MAAIIAENFVMPKIKIKRQKGFEKCLVEKFRPIMKRRQTVGSVGIVRRKSIFKTRATSLGAIDPQAGPSHQSQQPQGGGGGPGGSMTLMSSGYNIISIICFVWNLITIFIYSRPYAIYTYIGSTITEH